MYCLIRFEKHLSSATAGSTSAELPQALPAAGNGIEKTSIWQLEVTLSQWVMCVYVTCWLERDCTITV